MKFGDLTGGDQFIYQCAADSSKEQERPDPILVYIKLAMPIELDGVADLMKPYTAVCKQSGNPIGIPDDTEVILLEK